MNHEYEEDIILTPDPSRIMEGLRDTGYDFNTALADIVDNSIAAHATKINIYVNINTNNEVSVYIADNGDGMDLEELKNAMTYGSSKRKDPHSLGKFGLGLKTASTAFCRKLSLLSRTSTSEYNEVCWDLDYIAKVSKWKLLHEAADEEKIALLEETTDGGKGTLVVWENVDRLMKSYSRDSSFKNAYDRIIKNLSSHLAMVFQRYIDRKFSGNKAVEITVNGKVIEAWDPFCEKEEKREVLYKNEQIVEMPSGEQLKFNLAVILLPRLEDWSSNEAYKNARINNDNEGFYIYRENRLLHYGDWLGMRANDPHISLLRVEFSFDSTLDELFNVDIKKSQIALNEDIFNFLKTSILPPFIRKANDLYRSTVNKKHTENSASKHDKANNVITNNASSLEKSRVDIIDEENNIVKVQNSNGSSVGKLKIVNVDDKVYHRVIAQQKGDDVYLWEPCLAGLDHAVYINTDHSFYSKVYSKINDADVAAGVDYLLWALAEAELSTWSDETKEQYKDMRYQTARALTKLLESLPDVEIEDEE